MAYTHTLMSLDALDKARDVARIAGGEAYLKDKASEISRALLERDSLPGFVTRREGSQWQRYEVRRREVGGGERRSMNAKSLTKLRQLYPKAYRLAVTEVRPEHAYSVRLDPLRAGTRSEEWAQLKTEGAERWRERLAARFADRDWTRPDSQAQTLYDLRELRKDEEKRLARAKVELMEFVVEHDLPLIIPSHGDGKLVLRENGMGHAIDYDLIETEFKAAATLITRTPIKGSVTVVFVPPKLDDPAEPDDSDDSAFSTGYRERMRL